MCGVAGWFSKQIIPSGDHETLSRMIRTIKHRGPDGQGLVVHDHAALGHVRLSIIDLSSGQQPMYSHDRRFTITYNGEIYNYKILRAELAKSGHHFATRSDTEVVMEIYRKYGWQGFSRLRGMYAFALWDHTENCGFLVRDPLGIKPLFIQQTEDGSVIFASEAKSILDKARTSAQLNTEQLHLLLNFRYIPGNASLFKNIAQLPPGQIFQWSPNKQTRFFKIDLPEVSTGTTLEQLRDSVYTHMTSDVEVGCYLSGGLDSSTIATLCKEKTGHALRSFTIDAGDDPREARYAAETANQLDIQNLQFNIEHNITSDFKRLIWHLEVPKINAAQNWQLAKSTSQYVKVALSGLGGDELFLGYNMHKILAWTASLHTAVPTLVSSTLGSILINPYRSFSRLQWSESERALLMLSNLGNWPKLYGLVRNLWDNPTMRQKIYGERMLSENLPNAFDTLEQLWPTHPDPVIAAAKFEWQHKLVNDLLWQEDRVSMAHGLEVRTPLVDCKLHGFVERFSREQLMSRHKLKAHMKQAVSSILPSTVLNRPKSGFQVDAQKFFHNNLITLAKQELNEKRVQEIGLFNYQFIKETLKFTPSKRLRWHYFILYFMILTHMWVELFESGLWRKKTF
jgi:asparagine synthase (glutamine-hydrolysing)